MINCPRLVGHADESRRRLRRPIKSCDFHWLANSNGTFHFNWMQLVKQPNWQSSHSLEIQNVFISRHLPTAIVRCGGAINRRRSQKRLAECSNRHSGNSNRASNYNNETVITVIKEGGDDAAILVVSNRPEEAASVSAFHSAADGHFIIQPENWIRLRNTKKRSGHQWSNQWLINCDLIAATAPFCPFTALPNQCADSLACHYLFVIRYSLFVTNNYQQMPLVLIDSRLWYHATAPLSSSLTITAIVISVDKVRHLNIINPRWNITRAKTPPIIIPFDVWYQLIQSKLNWHFWNTVLTRSTWLRDFDRSDTFNW